MAVKVKIQPVIVKNFPEQKIANYVLITDVFVKLVDEGIIATLHFLDNENALIETMSLALNNQEIENWTNTDMQLVDAILNKLALTKVEE